MIRKGEVYELLNCPPLDGGDEKPRPVVVVLPLDEQGRVIVAACSSSVPHNSHPDKVRVSDTSTDPNTQTGLVRPTWCVPAWVVAVHEASLVRRLGHCGPGTTAKIVKAALSRLLDQPGKVLLHRSAKP